MKMERNLFVVPKELHKTKYPQIDSKLENTDLSESIQLETIPNYPGVILLIQKRKEED